MNLRILNPDATPEEIAALVVALATMQRTASTAAARRTSNWAAPSRAHRHALQPSAEGWRSHHLPR
jgi:predicted DNA-binding transcriptional regulator YafY